MEQFEEIRNRALELYHQNKINIVDHALERMIERNIQYEDIESVLLQGSIYKQEIDSYGDIRYNPTLTVEIFHSSGMSTNLAGKPI